MLNNRKRRPTHPGEVLREEVLPGLDITQGAFAEMLGVSRRTLVELLHERRSVTPDVAHRLARVLETTPEVWLQMQMAVDLWDELERNAGEYKTLKAAPGVVRLGAG
jgi:addiction module HigA family antidote